MSRMDKNNKAMDFVNNGTEGLYREGEEIIAKSAVWSYWYARDNIKGRFTAGEETIKRSENWSDYIWFFKSKGIEI